MIEKLPSQRDLNPNVTFIGGRSNRPLHRGFRSALILAMFVPAHHARDMAECSKTEGRAARTNTVLRNASQA
jgi:hypothetical protein